MSYYPNPPDQHTNTGTNQQTSNTVAITGSKTPTGPSCITTTIPGVTVTNVGWNESVLQGIENAKQGNFVPSPVEDQDIIQQGWECPKCNTVYAPFVPSCKCDIK